MDLRRSYLKSKIGKPSMHDHLTKKFLKHMIEVIIAFVIIAVLLVQLEKVSSWMFVHGPDKIKMFFESMGIFAPIIFILAYIILNLLLMPSIPLIFIAGIVFVLSIVVLWFIAIQRRSGFLQPEEVEEIVEEIEIKPETTDEYLESELEID